MVGTIVVKTMPIVATVTAITMTAEISGLIPFIFFVLPGAFIEYVSFPTQIKICFRNSVAS